MVGYGKKFSEEEFQKQMKNFNMWEQKKREKLQRLKYEQDQKIYEAMTKQNIHYKNKKKNKLQNSNDVVNRLYVRDIQYRKEQRQILVNALKPPFQPEIYTT